MFDAWQAGACLQSAQGGYELTAAGATWLAGMGLQPDPPSPRRRYAYPCLDGSERRNHLARQPADQIHLHFETKGWAQRGSGRAVALTAAGQHELLPHLWTPPA